MTTLLKLSIAAAILAGGLLAGGGAYAGGGNHHPHFTRLIQAPAAYDPFWKLKNPGGPVEFKQQIAAQNLRLHPGVIAGFNPQPDPPGFQ